MSAHGTSIVGTEPLSNAATAHDVPTERQAYCQFEKAGFRVHCAAFFQADDASLFLVRWDAVFVLQELAKERFRHGRGVGG